MKKKIFVGSVIIIGIAGIFYGILYYMLFQNTIKANSIQNQYESVYEQDIQGRWEAVSLTYGGQELEAAGKTITFKDKEMVYEENGVAIEEKSGKYYWVEEEMIIVSSTGESRSWVINWDSEGKMKIEDKTVNAVWILEKQ